MTSLDLATITELLTGEQSRKFPIPEQHGPLRYHDTEDRCTSRGCGSPTHYKLLGARKCTAHCLKEMNEMLDAFYTHHKNEGTFPNIDILRLEKTVEPENEVPGLL